MKDIERWIPDRWDQFLGNQELKVYFYDLIWCVRKEGHRSGFNLLTTGPSRTGKTSMITFGIKCLGCLNFDFETMNPCGKCKCCTLNHHLYGNEGWENVVDFENERDAPTPVRYHYLPLDCSRFSESELEQILLKLRVKDENLRVVYLDEVHWLARRSMDDKLLKPLEDFPAIWIASSAYVKRDDRDGESNNHEAASLEKMFQNRFSFRITTTKPDLGELIVWLAERCHEWGIQVETPKKTLERLAERSHQVVGMALQVINKAHKKRSKLLTLAMVEEHTFDLDD
ncbi:hypothetical protein [Anatilimnocola floriformis]|uniref:hypothetical protein n=1 Tax=Anatilimnocola floriformis TaxID=2948575 RepID=UPI0020C48D53|nr:hypothetical protein [Anatilimnocola floriformis]